MALAGWAVGVLCCAVVTLLSTGAVCRSQGKVLYRTFLGGKKITSRSLPPRLPIFKLNPRCITHPYHLSSQGPRDPARTPSISSSTESEGPRNGNSGRYSRQDSVASVASVASLASLASPHPAARSRLVLFPGSSSSTRSLPFALFLHLSPSCTAGRLTWLLLLAPPSPVPRLRLRWPR